VRNQGLNRYESSGTGTCAASGVMWERLEVIAQGTAVNRLPPRRCVAGISVSCATYNSVATSVIEAAQAPRPLLVAATSVHGLSLGATDREFGQQLNSFDIVTPDGQPVRWALNLLHHAGLKDRVYGPTMMLKICELAAARQLGIYFYGSRPEVLQRLTSELQRRVPGIQIVGYRSPPFRPTTHEEDEDDVLDILRSGAQIVFVGLGCPRQERWTYAHRDRLPMPLVCVGAAFDMHAGMLRQAPGWMQRRGLEWLFRLIMEPRRLWRRYTTHIPIFLSLIARQYAAKHVWARIPIKSANHED
jgi:N-acetylglucosaminyldiphosphoundecaprenol N-acetyl-beta-D-mannosaminyltransferase